jgi:sugar/nucleoside kinase (ribokinase family)
MTNLSCVTVGDINIDYVSDISGLSLSQDLSGCFMRPIRSFVGGNGVFFAEAASDIGFTPSYLVASVGVDKSARDIPDFAAKTAIQSLARSGVIPILAFDPDQSTGRVIILYQPNNQRVMIADRGANAGLTINRIQPAIDLLDSHYIDLLYVSGYCLLDDGEREAVGLLMDNARSKNTFIVVDMVPHDLFIHVTLDTFKQWTSCAHAVMAEASTVLGFLGRHEQQNLAAETKPLVARQLLDSYDFCLIRLNERSDFMIADHHKHREVYIPYHSKVASLRFTDRVLASALFFYLNNKCSIPDNDEWVMSATDVTSKYLAVD